MLFFAKSGMVEAAGLYGLDHLLAVLIVLFAVGFGLFFSRKFTYIKIKKTLKIIFIVILILEVAKIIYTITAGNKNIEDIVSLSFCALFLYAVALAAFGEGAIEKMGLSYIFYGGMIAGLIYLISPIASLNFYPLWHFRSLQSLIYHGAMLYSGLLITYKGLLKPSIKDFKPFFLFCLFFSVFAVLSNFIFDTNYMYLNNRLSTSIMSIFNFLPNYIYIPFVILGQICGSFFLTFGLYKLCENIKNKKAKTNNEKR